jgi:hypothetical protein
MSALPVGPTTVEPRGRAARLLAGLLRFFGLWAAITGAYAVMGGTCPFCGNSACPVGLGFAGILGALGSLVLTQGRRLFTSVRRALTHGGHQ